MPRLRLAEQALSGVLRFSGYQAASLLPEPWLRWLRSRNAAREIVEKLSINCVLDVGANTGQFGTMLRRMGYRGLIVSFEPVRANFELLKEIAASAQPWHVFGCALGESSGRRRINVTDNTVFSSFLVPDCRSLTRFPQSRVVRAEEVEIRRLDDIFPACGSGASAERIFLKLDTQGFDLDVARGAEVTLRKALAVQTEISFLDIYGQMNGFMDSIRYFQALGYDVVDFVPVSRDMSRLRAVDMDCLMVRIPT